MDIAALITWLVTAVGGFVMLGMWYSGGGQRPDGRTRLSPGFVFTHFGLAALGLVLWIVYVYNDSDVLAWLAFVLLLPVAALGFMMLARWLTARREPVPEARFPVVVVAGHGLFAATTLVLVLLAALDVGS